MTDDLVSIIMPSFNCEAYIAASIRSVLAQTYPYWELIIVDDCSTDDTFSIAQTFHDDRIKLFRNLRNSGAAISRNRALREAKGRWIAFLDSDDLWLPEKLEKQIAFMKENGYRFSYSDYVKINERSEPLGITVSGPKKITKRKMYNYCWPGCLTVMYDAEYFGLIQIKDIKKNNDYAMWLQLCKKADCYLLDEVLAKYRILKKSISHDKITKKIKMHYDVFRYCDDRSTLSAVWLACWNMFFGVVKKVCYEKKIHKYDWNDSK